MNVYNQLDFAVVFALKLRNPPKLCSVIWNIKTWSLVSFSVWHVVARFGQYQ